MAHSTRPSKIMPPVTSQRLQETTGGTEPVRERIKNVLRPIFLFNQVRNRHLVDILPGTMRNKATFFKILTTVYVYSYKSSTPLALVAGCDKRVTRDSLAYLLGQGLVKQGRHARKLNVLNGAWMFDKVYSCTPAGNRVIRAGLRKAGIEF